jgi:hypothetical protein
MGLRIAALCTRNSRQILEHVGLGVTVLSGKCQACKSSLIICMFDKDIRAQELKLVPVILLVQS